MRDTMKLRAVIDIKLGFLVLVVSLACILFNPKLKALQSIGGSEDNTAGWVAVDRPSFVFAYPTGWQIQEQNQHGFSGAFATDPRSSRLLSIMFEPGFVNHPGILNQCAGVDEYLDSLYQKTFAPMATGTGQYPYTTVTHDDYKPGWMGGKSTWVTIVHVEAYQKPVTLEYWVDAVPREGGIYSIMYRHSSEPMQVFEPFRQQFINSITLKANALNKEAYCNYLGK